ncbi:cyclic nucleotide-binding domain-containing protein, partial [Pyxidicoccus fallax]
AQKESAQAPRTPPQAPPVWEQRSEVVTHLVRSSPLFSRLSQPVLQSVRDAFTPCTVDAGEQILTRGQAAQALYLILRGRCTVFHQHVDGHETAYPDLTEGDVFGEVSLLRSKLVTASVRAATPCLLLKLERAAFEQLLEAEPELRRELQRMGAERLWRTTRLLTGRAPAAEDAGASRPSE